MSTETMRTPFSFAATFSSIQRILLTWLISLRASLSTLLWQGILHFDGWRHSAPMSVHFKCSQTRTQTHAFKETRSERVLEATVRFYA